MKAETVRVRYSDGSTADGLIIRLAGRNMRVAIAGRMDTVEFRLLLDDWVSDTGEVVSFEFGFSGMPGGLAQYGTAPVPYTPECAAGGDCMLRKIAEASLERPAN